MSISKNITPSSTAQLQTGRRQFVQATGATWIAMSLFAEMRAIKPTKNSKEQAMEIKRNGSQASV
ncbi:MAG: hypothetical protein KDB23_14410, partial [Planctomycetales bacterium]|nr:hypothetical protein [Planctomycetales bacterium]